MSERLPVTLAGYRLATAAAAPLTTYLLGAAVAGGADPQEAAATINRLATDWAERAG